MRYLIVPSTIVAVSSRSLINARKKVGERERRWNRAEGKEEGGEKGEGE